VGPHVMDQTVPRRCRSIASERSPDSIPATDHAPTVRARSRHAEHDDFHPRFATHEGLPDSSSESGLVLQEADKRLRVQLVVTPFGMPRRWRRRPARRLACGEWLRWQVNYRFAGSHGGEWTYRLETLNIGYGPALADLFLGTPTHHVDELGTLR
jgi:hypothetical protein